MIAARIVRPAVAALALMALASGCSGLETDYGFVSGRSVNGTGALFHLFQEKGNQVRIARRYSDKVGSWADTIVRFSPHPGPPDQKEAEWLQTWLTEDASHRLIYVAHDFEAQHEYWVEVLRTLPAAADPKRRERIDREQSRAASWPLEIPPPAKSPASRDDWFAVDSSAKSPAICKRLAGPWAAGVDVEKAALSRRQTIDVDAETLLLSGDGKPLVVDYTWSSGSQVLIIANGSFLLNEPLARPARRSLAKRVVDWPGGESRHVAFIEGTASTDKSLHAPSMFDLLFVDPLGWIGGHLIALGLIGGLASAVRLGRPRNAPPSGADRPVAHAEALGGLLSRTRDFASAVRELEAVSPLAPSRVFQRREVRDVADRHAGIPDRIRPRGPSMSIEFSCPHCNRPYKVADDLGGKYVKCKECQGVMTVPAFDAVMVLGADAIEPENPALGPGPTATRAVRGDGPVAAWATRVLAEVNKVYVGQNELVRGVLIALLADGHVLIESVPGLGKTLLVRTLGRVLGIAFNRIQFTPDLMPSDVTGSPIFDERIHDFRFRPGPVFTQLLLADEINRAPPRRIPRCWKSCRRRG